MSTNETLAKINFNHTFDDIIKILKLSNKKKKEVINIIGHYKKLTQPYLGPHPNNDSKYVGGFGFYIVTSSHDNNGKSVKDCEGYPHLPYQIDEIIFDECRNLDWYNFGISHDFLELLTLDTPDEKIKQDLQTFLMERASEYKSYGLPLLDNYEKKLTETQEFITKRISEYRNIINNFISELKPSI